MRKLQKLGFAMAASVLSLAMYGGITADAKVVPPLTLNYGDQSFQFREFGEGEYGEGAVSFDAVKIKGKGDSATLNWNGKAKWDVYDVSDQNKTVDLSSKKTTQDILVAIKDVSDSAPVVFWIPADTSKYKGKYESGSVSITDAGNLVDANIVKFEYRTENGNWKNYDPADKTAFTAYEQQGATLYFRRKAVEVDSNGYSSATDRMKQEDRTQITMVCKAKGTYFASKEFKVKITKKSNAPSISVDYTWQTLKVKDTMEYRAMGCRSFEETWEGGKWLNGSGNGEWTEVPSGVTKLNMTDLFVEDGVTRDCIVEIRTKADPAKKKPASKPCVLKFPGAMPLSTQKFGLTNKYGNVNDGLPDQGLIFKLLKRKGKNYCRFINSDPDLTYEIYNEDPFENNKAAKVAIVKSATSQGNTEVEVDAKKVPEGCYLYVLIAADKSKQRFRSRATKCGGTVMVYPTEDTE